jgi:hypothetical protein
MSSLAAPVSASKAAPATIDLQRVELQSSASV